MSDIVIYENGELALKATVENETIWLRQNQIAEIFAKDRTVISTPIYTTPKNQIPINQQASFGYQEALHG